MDASVETEADAIDYLALGTEGEFTVTTKNYGEVTIPKSDFVVPQVGTSAAAIEFAGGEEKFVEQYNDYVANRAKNNALAGLRNAAAGSVVGELIRNALAAARGFNPAAERVSKAKVLEGVETLRSRKEELASMSKEEIMALLDATLRL